MKITGSAIAFSSSPSETGSWRMMLTMTVLIADDSPLVRERLVKLIARRHPGAQVRESQDVPSTINAIDNDRPDVLILDLRMPGGNGFDVLSHIHSGNLAIRVIVLTNFASEENERKSRKLGAHFFFDKTKEFERALDVLASEI
jgi:DNA-binding NarL/FixJ family response regulator